MQMRNGKKMSLAQLLSLARPLLEQRLLADPPPVRDTSHPPCVLFFSIGNRKARAHVQIASGNNFSQAWQAGVQGLQTWLASQNENPEWLRIDAVHTIEALAWSTLRKRLARTKRNYFRFGLAFLPDFSVAILEQELGANAVLYDNQHAVAFPNAVNLAAYGQRRFARALSWPQSDASVLWRFTTRAVFADERAAHCIEHEGGNSGYRQLPDWGADSVHDIIRRSTAYLSRQVKPSGQYEYGWFPCFDRAIPTYNALRHASSTYAMLEGWDLTRDDRQFRAIEGALDYLSKELIKNVNLPDGTQAAFVVDVGNEVKLGANGVALLAFTKHAELTQDRQHLPLMESLARGIAHMQDPDTGGFVHVLNYPDLSLKARHRIIYYDGEAAFSLMRLYGMTKDARWLRIVEHAFEYFIASRHWEAHDHWLSYAVNELTLYRPEEKYFRFGLDNVSGHLDFVLERITTYPTLLELMMAAQRMIVRMQQDHGAAHLLDGFDLEKFHRALEHRARYLLNGFFWPELAMYFKNPARIEDGFFIRHHTYRVRIDDVEHYLSGLVVYWKYLQQGNGPQVPKEKNSLGTAETSVSDLPCAHHAVVAWGGDINLGRRQHYRTAELGMGNVLSIPALQQADLRIVNLECVVSTLGEQGVDKGEGGPYYYRARPEMLGVLQTANIDVVCTANNHAGDYGPQALLEQAQLLDAVGIAHVGSGADWNAALEPVFVRAGSVPVAVFSLDFTQERFAATAARAGIAYFPLGACKRVLDALTPRIQAARAVAQVVLVAVHWGRNQAVAPDAEKIAMGHTLIDAGADAVLGASAHVLQGVEIYKDRPIVHDAGDLLFDSVRTTPADGGVFQLGLGPRGVCSVRFVPIAVEFGYSRQQEGACAAALGEKYAAASKLLGTIMTVHADGSAEVRLSPPEAGIAALPQWEVESVPAQVRMDPVRIGPLRLLGARVTPAKISRREMLWVESFWQTDTHLSEDLRLDIRAIPVKPGSMPIWGKGMDHDPCDWAAPTSRWQPGKIYRDFYGLRPPPRKGLVDGDLQVVVGLAGGKQVCPDTWRYPTLIPVTMKDMAGNTRMEVAPEVLPSDAQALAQFLGGKWLVSPPKEWRCRGITCKLNARIAQDHVIALELLLPSAQIETIATRLHRNRIDERAVLMTDQPQLVHGLENPVLLVEDTKISVEKWLRVQRQKYRGKVFSVTGSVGKTTTCAMLGYMLGEYGSCHVSAFNRNMTRGVYESALEVGAQDYALFEVAVGGLPRVAPVLRAHVAVFLSLAPAHMQFFSSVEDVAMRKASIFAGAPEGAVAVICRDMPFYDKIRQIALVQGRTVLTFGKSAAADFSLLRYEAQDAIFAFSFGGEVFSVRQAEPGEHVALNMLAAIAALQAAGLDWRTRLQDMALKCVVPQGRGNVRHEALRSGNCTVLDHAYNANPASMSAALRTLADWPVGTGRRVAVLSDMLEMGQDSRQFHAGLRDAVVDANLDLLLLAGSEMEALAAVLPDSLAFRYFPTVDQLMEQLDSALQPQDVVMIKGSNGTGLGKRMQLFFQEHALPALEPGNEPRKSIP